MKVVLDRYVYFTDELYVHFYQCPDCKFEYVPHLHDREYFDDPNEQTRYCPGCGGPIEWVPGA